MLEGWSATVPTVNCTSACSVRSDAFPAPTYASTTHASPVWPRVRAVPETPETVEAANTALRIDAASMAWKEVRTAVFSLESMAGTIVDSISVDSACRAALL